MFRVSPTPIIRNTQTVVTTTGTSHEFGEVMLKSDLKSPWKSSYLTLFMAKFGHEKSEVAGRPWTFFNRILTLHFQIHDLYQWL